jgi:hypothetical protein
VCCLSFDLVFIPILVRLPLPFISSFIRAFWRRKRALGMVAMFNIATFCIHRHLFLIYIVAIPFQVIGCPVLELALSPSEKSFNSLYIYLSSTTYRCLNHSTAEMPKYFSNGYLSSSGLVLATRSDGPHLFDRLPSTGASAQRSASSHEAGRLLILSNTKVGRNLYRYRCSKPRQML